MCVLFLLSISFKILYKNVLLTGSSANVHETHTNSILIPHSGTKREHEYVYCFFFFLFIILFFNDVVGMTAVRLL